VLVSGDLHCVWLNTAALEGYGHAGHPTGLLREGDAFAVVQQLEVVSDGALDEWADAAAREAAKRGVVGIVDFEMAWNLDSWSRRIDAGTRSVRVEFGICTEHLDRAIDLGLRTGQVINDRLTVGHFKILTDGSLNTRTAYCYDEYPGLDGQPGSRGMLTVEPDRLRPLMRLASDAGILPAVHAIGDHANSLALDAFETIGCRGRIEHAQLLIGADLPRFAKLGVEASVQPDHAMDDRDVADHYWAGRTGRAFALRSLIDAGATLRLGSDAPVSSLDPWNTIAAAVGRARDGREPWHPEQSISVREALDASSRSTLRKGQPADVVVLDRDPERSTADELRTMPVVATMVGGEFTHRAL
jgi:predicted amidohydrolase YtcJ